MSSNSNGPKVQVSIILAIIICVVILVSTAGNLTSRLIVSKFHQDIEHSSANFNLKELVYQNRNFSLSKKVSIPKTEKQVFAKPRPIIKSKQIGYISKVYEKAGRRYLSFDDVKFLTGNAAIEAAKKDGTAIYEDGKYYVDDDYYIVNNNKNTKSYVIASNASLKLLGFLINPSNNDINNHSTNYANFKRIANSRNGYLLCYIYTQNNIIVKAESQYTP
ncbi:hypothetical protein KPL37_17690 [Clostridium frigoris]|uniref:Methyl-accepting chemotaxis protein n=1 Tax=Clostridium frigoris TaxID=205327 RepID=A0ABS6BY65_9CLOT|nr:hypothetical protein [Clostridium frigoris]MBU3161542.1 hypothetical protein [Clostridium frigoris]